MVSCKLIK